CALTALHNATPVHVERSMIVPVADLRPALAADDDNWLRYHGEMSVLFSLCPVCQITRSDRPAASGRRAPWRSGVRVREGARSRRQPGHGAAVGWTPLCRWCLHEPACPA